MARVTGPTERRRWMMLVLALIAALGGGLFVTLLIVEGNQREAQRDLCALVAVFDDPSAPPPSTDRGRAQQRAMRDYRAKRC